MSDKQLNITIASLLAMSDGDRRSSHGWWARMMDMHMREWGIRFPGTRPPCYAGREIPACFAGRLAPIYQGELKG